MKDDRPRCRQCHRLATAPLLFFEFCDIECYRESIAQVVAAEAEQRRQTAMLLHAAKAEVRRRESKCPRCGRAFQQPKGKRLMFCGFPCASAAKNAANEANELGKATPESVAERTAIVRAFKMQNGETESGRRKTFPFAEYASL